MSTQTRTQPTTRIEPRKFTTEEFLKLYEAGVFAESERVELLNGEVFTMSPMGPLHNGTIIRLIRLLTQLAGDNATVSAQCSMLLNEHSQPEPDFALLKPRDDDYTKSLAQPHEVLLLIEVSHTSLHYDLHLKLPLYAAAKIPEVWIVDLNKKQSFCCGAGGGRMWMEEDLGKRVNVERTDQALATKPDAIAVNCPFCLTMFDDGLKHRGASHVRLMDLAELIADNLVTKKQPSPTAPDKAPAAAE
jgi:Uma2 family endonuclease